MRKDCPLHFKAKGYFGTLLGRADFPFCLHEKAPAAGHFQTGQRVPSFI